MSSLINLAACLGMQLVVSLPGYAPDPVLIARARARRENGGQIRFRPTREAVKGAAFVYTDMWASMGQESQARRAAACSGRSS